MNKRRRWKAKRQRYRAERRAAFSLRLRLLAEAHRVKLALENATPLEPWARALITPDLYL